MPKRVTLPGLPIRYLEECRVQCSPEVSQASVSIQTDPKPPPPPLTFQLLFQVADYTKKDYTILEAANEFIASPLSTVIAEALIRVHNILFTRIDYQVRPTMIPVDPTMRFIGMYLKGLYATWLKYQV